MSKESSGDAGKVVASVIAHRVLSTTITLGGLIITSIYFVVMYKPPMLVVEL
jgi:hypothetical protein